MKLRLIFVAALFIGANTSALAESEEVGRLKNFFEAEVGQTTLPENYWEKAQVHLLSVVVRHGGLVKPEFVVLVDRNHEVQRGMIVYLDPAARQTTLVGSFLVSTGNPARRGFFETPTGFFRNAPENMSYRALGTKNSKGWRGLGAKGSRVWDFGWQETKTTRGEPYQIRLLLHATDPEQGEPRLSKVDSKGCVRISGKVNLFLDRHGILDALFEDDEKAKAKAVLRKDRTPAAEAGKYMIVWDSGIS